ncbi:hypothetical protein Tco_1420928 [Tanacetum coccineum]
MFHNLDQLRLQLERENLHGVNAKTFFKATEHSSRNFLPQKGRELLENLDTLEAVIHRVVNTYGVLRMKENELNALKENGSQLHDEILHEHQIKSSVKMQSQDIQINPVQAMDDSLQEENVNMREAVDAGLVVTESSGSYTTQAVDADIGPVHDDEPFAEVQLTALHNILANEQQHTEQSEPIRQHIDARKMTQDKTGIPSHRDMASTRAHCTPNACTPKPRNIYSISPVSKLYFLTSSAVHCQSFKGKTRSLVTKKTDISYVRSSRNSNLMNMLQMMSVHISSGLVLHLDDVWTKQFKPRSSSKDVWTKQFRPQESDSTIPDPSHQTVTSTPPVIAPLTDVSSTKPSSLVTPPPINTEATTITTSLPEITPFIALQLRVARLEQEMSEVKKTDHSADILERHTADLIEKYSVLPGPESIKNQESEKSPKEIIRIKREQGEEKQDSTYSIRSTDKVALEEFDLKSALFKHMNKNKTANRNPANYHLYHALMEALIADEDAMDKEVTVKVKDHKRKHDSDDDEDDDDDEGPSAGSNQGRSAKRRRPESAASGSAQPPPKDDDQSSKKPRESDASASKQHPALTSTGWQITDTRDDVVNSLMHMLPNNIQITDTNSFIVSKKRSSDSSKKLKGIQTLTPAEQEAADIMKALKESKKMSKRQPGTGGSNEGTGNILGVPDESTVISRASSEGTGSKPGVPDEEKLIL